MTLRLIRFASWLVVGAFGVVSIAATSMSIVPLRTSARITPQSIGSRWSVPVKSSKGHVAYILSLEPEVDVGNHLVSAELVLRPAGENAAKANLLEPSGNWHGLQPYMFPANGFATGVAKAPFGETRKLTLKNLGVQVQVTITEAKVTPISSDGYQLDSLSLDIELSNL